MIPIRLTLEGFLSYITPTTIDLSPIKVACVSGPNGAGKSTLFDAITWSLFGKARRNDDALIHNKADRCQVVFEFEYENLRYRVDRAKPRGKGTTLEFHVCTDDGSWKPFTESGVRATEQRIQDVLGLDYDTFVNASFFLQGNADMFSVQTPGKRKEILSNILGLMIWEDYREETSRRRREAQKQLKVQHSILEEINNELSEEDERKERLKREKELLATKTKLRESIEKMLEDARLENAWIKSEKEKLDILSGQLDELTNNIASNKNKLKARKVELEAFDRVLDHTEQITQSYQEYQKLREELTEMETIAEKYHACVLRKTRFEGDIQSQKVRLEQELKSLLSRESEIKQVETQQKKRDQEIKVIKNEITQLQAEIDKIDGLEKEQTQKKNLQSEKEGENIQLREKMDEIKVRQNHLKQSHGPDCPLCGQALTDTHKDMVVAKLEKDGTDFGDRYRQNLEEIKGLKQLLERTADRIKTIRALRPRLTELMGQAAAIQQQSQENAEKMDAWIEAGSSRLKHVRDQLETENFASVSKQELSRLNEEIASLDFSPQAHVSMREKEQMMRTNEERFRKLEQAQTACTGLRREIDELTHLQKIQHENTAQLTVSIQELEQQIVSRENKSNNLEELEAQLRDARLNENQARENVGKVQQTVNVLEKLRVRKTKLDKNAQQISRQITRYKILEIAFGKDGVPALLIENAIPQIETQANEILDKLSGGKMSVSFETERKYADKKRKDKKQTLDIIIRDNAGARPYELFSGGEAFRINFAIRLALSRVLAQRSGARLQTLVIDEGFGSQDAEGRQRLVEAINLVRNDFEKILVITHLDELKDAFSSRIEVSKTIQGSQVEVVI